MYPTILSLRVPGTFVGIFGSDIGTGNPPIQCIVDGATVSNNQGNVNVNQQLQCQAANLADGEHTITVNVSPNTNGYWFDFVMIIPSAGVSLDNAAMMIDMTATDSTEQFGTGWSQVAPGYMTNTQNSQFTFAFAGTHISGRA